MRGFEIADTMRFEMHVLIRDGSGGVGSDGGMGAGI